MCGRFTLHHSAEEVAERFGAQEVLFRSAPRFNLAPTQNAPVITQNGVRALQGFRWGLVPSWAKDQSIGTKMINARAETLAEKPAFKSALKRRRCLVPADGFFEWNRAEARQPYHIRREDGGLFAFAGLWDEWRAPGEPEPLHSFTIVTTAPNALMSALHHRMAVILRPEDEALWLDPTVDDVPSLLDCLAPYEYDSMEAFRIGRRVGRVDIDDAELIAPLGDNAAEAAPPSDATGSLFD